MVRARSMFRAVKLRPARASDAEAIWQVRTAAIRAGCSHHYASDVIESWTSAPMPPTFAAFVSHERFVVAESNDRVVGFGGLKVATKEVDALFVSPDFAGQGLGARLLAWVEDAALSLGIDAVTLKASLNSVPFYLQAGYFSGAAGTHVTANGTAIPCLHMEKSLGANHAVV